MTAFSYRGLFCLRPLSLTALAFSLPVRLAQGWSVRYEGGTTATVRDANNRRVRSLIVDPGDFRIESGRHAASINSSLKPDQDARARLELRPSGETERVAANVGDGGQTREE